MAAFTTITTGSTYLSLEVVQELVLAYSERRQCVGAASVTAIAAGENLQDVTFWRGMQDWVETNCGKWVDYVSFTENAFPENLGYTLAEFRVEADLHADGFRRATDWPGTFLYGKIVAGDIIGPWIIEDLQKAFDALRWTFETSIAPVVTTVTYENDESKWSSGDGSTEQEAYDNAAAAWPAVWTTPGAGYPYRVRTLSTLFAEYNHLLERDRADVKWSAIPTHLPHSGSGYYFIELYGSGAESADLDSLGMSNLQYYSMLEFQSGSVSTRTLTALAIHTPPPQRTGAPYEYDALSINEVLFLKWEFTNTIELQ